MLRGGQPQAQRKLNAWRYQVLHLYFGPAIVNPAPVHVDGPKVELLGPRSQVNLGRRGTHSKLRAPTVIITTPPSLEQATVRVKLAGRKRLELGRHAPHFFLRPPTVVEPTRYFGPKVISAAKRSLLDRRGTHYALRPPTVVTPQALAPEIQRTIRRLLVAVRTRAEFVRHAPHYHLFPPATLVEDECHPTIHDIPTSDFVLSPLSPDGFSPSSITPDGLTMNPTSADPLSISPTSADDLGAPTDPC